jgi:glutaminyl-tRNA synthetase
VKGVIHWVSAADAVEAEVRLFNNLFIKEDPNNLPEGMDWMELINPESMVVTTAYMEPSLADAPVGVPYQFERVGYFCKDKDSTPEKPVFNRTVELKSSFVIK